MSSLVSILSAVPGDIWSGIFGALLALSGVLISNRSTTTRLRIQLQHDAVEKAKERTSALRREIYLRTVEELVKANSHLSSLPNLDPTKINIGEGLQGFFAAAARLQLVAEPKTAVVVTKLVAEYSDLLFSLLAQVMPAHKARSDIELADRYYTQYQAEASRVLGGLAKINESGKSDPVAFQALQNTFEFNQAQSEKFAADRNDAWSRFSSANIQFQRAVVISLRDLAPRQFPVLIELRRDLGLSGHMDELEAQMREQMLHLEGRFNELIARLSDAPGSIGPASASAVRPG